MSEAIKDSNIEFKKNNALNEEAAKKFATTESRLAITNNKWKAFGATV